MFLTARAIRRPRSLVLGTAVGLLTCLATVVASVPASALTPASVAARPAVAATPVAALAARSTTSVADLALTGTRTRVTVGRVQRSGQVRWINHVLDARLVNIDGCQAQRTTAARRGNVYRASVYAVCPAGPGAPEAAAKALVRSRPWYRVSVERLRLVGFVLVAEGAAGSDRAVPDALAKLPSGPSVFFEGDDVSFTYAGPGVTQARLDAALAAFAAALGVPTSQVTVTPLAG